MQEVQAEQLEVLPAFSENNIAILFAASDNYMPYFSTLLQSILENSSSKYNYDIIVFHRNITPENMDIIHKQYAQYPNFLVRFYNILPVMEPYMDLYVLGHFTIEMYFRLLAPFILKSYDKILYLDSDILVIEDVAKLYMLDLSATYFLAACKDADFSAEYNRSKYKRKYCATKLKLKNPYNYFQSGVLLFNLKTFRNHFTSTQILDFARTEKWQYPDQDILNILTQEKVCFVDMKWNMLTNWANKRIKKIKKFAPKELCKEYLWGRKNFCVIHYAGPDKPWHYDTSDFAINWWQYANKTPYAEFLQNKLFAYKKGQKKFKNKLKRVIKKVAMPFVDLFFPYGSKFREKLRKKFWS